MTARTASCFLHGYYDATLTRCPKCATDALTRRAAKAEAERDRLREALANLTPSPDGGYGPNNAAAWKDEYIDRLRETLDAERECGRLREQLDWLARQLEGCWDDATALASATELATARALAGNLFDALAAARAALGVVGEADNE